MRYFSVMVLLLFSHSLCFSRDVNVKGYHRKDGTYIAPHVRSSPDSHKWNNYGSNTKKTYEEPKQRDHDNDGTPNYLDTDDNNDGIHDDYE